MASDIPSIRTERLTLKNITINDTENIVKWRSDPEVYRFFLSPHPINEEEHKKWFKERYLNDCNRCDWMAFDENDEPVGVFGVKRNSSEAKEVEISYILNPCKTGMGFAREAMAKLIDYVSEAWKPNKIIAEIHIENTNSIKFAKKLGLSLYDINGKFCTYVRYIGDNEKKIVYIRCDGNQVIGVGHVMRCMSIADRLKGLGKYPIFLLSDSSVTNLVQENGYRTIDLDTQWNKLENEIELLERILKSEKRISILVDSYYATPSYLERLDLFADVTYLDDLCISKYDVKNVVNYNYYSLDMKYADLYIDGKTALYLGPKYVPLRSEFQNIKYRKFGGIKKILITSGGTDNYNVLGSLLEYFVNQHKRIEIFAIIGKFNSNMEELNSRYGRYDYIHLLKDVENMHEYMKGCDLCITAGGTTLYELCACGTPSLMYVIADNQMEAAKKFNDTQLIPCLGDAREEMKIFNSKIADWIDKYSNGDKWERISREMQAIVDANGAYRIAELL